MPLPPEALSNARGFAYTLLVIDPNRTKICSDRVGFCRGTPILNSSLDPKNNIYANIYHRPYQLHRLACKYSKLEDLGRYGKKSSVKCSTAREGTAFGQDSLKEVHEKGVNGIETVDSRQRTDGAEVSVENSSVFSVVVPLTEQEQTSERAEATGQATLEQISKDRGEAKVSIEDEKELVLALNFPLLLQHVWQRLKAVPFLYRMSYWPPWDKKKRLEYLYAEADAHPKDASKQAALYRELLIESPKDVIERFERREHAANGDVVLEYFKALVATNAISNYFGEGQRMTALMEELNQRAGGDLFKPSLSLGVSEEKPLHVVMVEPKTSSKSVRVFQEIVSAILFMMFFSILWFMGTTALRKYVKGSAGISPSSGMGAPGVYSTKEFNKETAPEKNSKTFKDVKGCDEAKAELEEIVEYLRNPTKFTRLGGKLPKGVLLVGPPGTGKTLLAKAIAGEAGVPFFYRAGSEFEEMFVGVGARRVRSLFQAAKKKAPCIVFIDEIDAVGSSRKHWEGHTKKTLNQLLVEMDGFEANEGIIVIAATNLPESLDPALVRPGRFDRHVVVPNPDVRGRQEILELYLNDKPLADNIDVKLLAKGTPGFTGADLANLVNMAAVKAALDEADKISTYELEYAKDKIIMGAERKSMLITEESRKLTAYHESGHAVVAFNTAGASPIHKATITPRGNSLGMVAQLPDSETSVSKLQMLARLDVCMGGRVAEEMIFGPQQVTSGARNDLQQATALARHMVAECGMSDEIGPIFVDPRTERPSHEMQKSIDAEVLRLLKDAYSRVKDLLRKHEADLHALARALLENETLNAQEIKDLLTQTPQVDSVVEVDTAAMGVN